MFKAYTFLKAYTIPKIYYLYLNKLHKYITIFFTFELCMHSISIK